VNKDAVSRIKLRFPTFH